MDIIPYKYPGPPFPEGGLKVPKNTDTGVQICARTPVNLIIQGKGVQEEARVWCAKSRRPKDYDALIGKSAG